jgi:TolA-binding protein
LARFEPPGYVALSFRGANDEPDRFAAAMERYSRRDYPGAARALREVVREHPEAAAPQFYLGISELMAGRAEAGARALAAAARSGHPAYVPAARFYLGRAHLARGDVASAKVELEAVAETAGDLATEARALLRALQVPGAPQ